MTMSDAESTWVVIKQHTAGMDFIIGYTDLFVQQQDSSNKIFVVGPRQFNSKDYTVSGLTVKNHGIY